MNYSDRFDAKFSADGPGPHQPGHVHTHTVHATQVPPDAVVVSDANLLFHGDFKRAGVDLVLSGDGKEVVLHDYFKGDKHAPLASPDGAHLSGDLVSALAGHVEYAQADGNATGAHQVIGHVTKLVGTATAIRNGVSIILNNGDDVEKGDVVQSGADSTLGITFIDGTVFGLLSNARMVLNEMIYDPNGSNNSSLLSLVAGTITFVAGETAKHGDMKVDTPVATMGIRGTAVLVEIDFSVPGTTPDARFQVLVEPDGTTGSYILFDKTTLTPLAVVNQSGVQINISNGILSQTTTPLSPEIQKLIQDVFSLKFTDNSNTKLIQHFTDIVVPTSLGETNFGNVTGTITIPTLITTANANNLSITNNGVSFGRVLDAPTANATDGIIIAPSVVAGSGPATVSGTIRFTDINSGDRPTVTVTFESFTYHSARGNPATAQQLAGIQALEAALTLVPNSGNANNGADTWTYSVPASALIFLGKGDTLTLSYDAVVNNNYAPFNQSGSAQFTITITNPGEIWTEPKANPGAAPGDWNTGANWSSGVAPASTDDVIIGTGQQQNASLFFPVTIKSAASANSVTMGDSSATTGDGGNAPELDNYSMLTIGSGGLHLNADSILKNFGTISIAGIAEILQSSVLQNSGPLMKFEQGGEFGGSSHIINSGTIEVAGGALNPLTVEVGIDNSCGTLQVDSSSVLRLSDGATITMGALTLAANSKLDVESAVGATLDGVKVTGTGGILPSAITVAGGATLTLDAVTLDNVTLAGSFSDLGTETIDHTVTVDGATLDGGTIDDTGTLLVTAASEIENATVDGCGNITVASGQILTLDAVTLDDVTLSGSFLDKGTETIDGMVTLDGATLNGGTINIAGVLDSTGTSLIDDATIINPGHLNVVSGSLTIDPTPITNTGTIEVYGNAGLVLGDDVITNSVTTSSKTTNGTIQVDQQGTLSLNGVSINGGIFNDFGGTVDVTGYSSINNTFSFVNAGTVQADGAELDLVGVTVDNACGTFKTTGSGLLGLENATINSGTLGGSIATIAGNTQSTLNGVTLALGALVTAAVGVLELTGTINNNGEIDANLGAVDLENATLNGGTLGGYGTIATVSGNFDSVLNNGTISGGTTVTAAVGALDLKGTITNKGEIDATTGQLHLENVTVASGTIGGTGTISTAFNLSSTLENVTIATHTKVCAASGVLDLTGTINNNGEIDATTGVLDLDNATVIGGTLGGCGTIATASSFNTLENVTIAEGTTVLITDGTTLDLVGTISDGGTIALDAFFHTTKLEISGNVLLNGGGDVTMSGDFCDFIVSDGSAATLINSDTISGAGTVGDAHLTLVNSGTIDATGRNSLIIDTGANSYGVGNLMVTNNIGGVLEASAGSTLLIEDNVLNNGLIEADSSNCYSPAFVNIAGNITGTGSIDIYNNAVVEITGSVDSGQTVTFGVPNGQVATGGLLILDDSHDFHGEIVGLVENSSESLENHVDLRDLAYRAGDMYACFNDGVLTVGNGLDHVTLNVATSDDSSGSFEFSSDGVLLPDGSYGTLLDDPPATGNVTIDSGQTLDITAASSATISFTNNNGYAGELVLVDSKDFTGTIAGFTGDGTIANSDLIDVTDVNFAQVALNKTAYTDDGNGTGTLTLYNASGHALDSINFAGNYQLANFTIENDGNGGTLIVDPPVNPSSQPASTIVASAPNQTLTGSAPSDNFVFNFANVGHSTIADFNPATDTLQFNSSIFANAQSALSAAHDDGHGDTVIAIDSHDSITLNGVLKAQLHASDFHVV